MSASGTLASLPCGSFNDISAIATVLSLFTPSNKLNEFLPCSIMSTLSLVTGLKEPRIVNTFFLYNISAGTVTEPSGLNIIARVFHALIKCKLIARLSISSK